MEGNVFEGGRRIGATNERSILGDFARVLELLQLELLDVLQVLWFVRAVTPETPEDDPAKVVIEEAAVAVVVSWKAP